MKKLILKITVILIFTCFGYINAYSQLWHKVGGGIDCDETGPYCIYNNELYVSSYIYQSYGGDSTQLNISKWNGSNWTKFPGLSFKSGRSYNSISKILFYKNELYLIGLFDSTKLSTKCSNIIHYDGTKWINPGVCLNKGKYAEIDDAVVYNNRLYVCGRFDTAGNKKASNIACWNGTTWSMVGVPGNEGLNGDVSHLEVYNNKLYVTGEFTKAGTSNAFQIACWDDTAWSGLDAGTPWPNSSMKVFNNLLYVYGGYSSKDTVIFDHGMSAWDGNKWINFTPGLDYVDDIASCNNKLYCIASPKRSESQEILELKGTSWGKISGNLDLYHGAKNLLDYHGKLFISGWALKFNNLSKYFLSNSAILDGVSWIPFDRFDSTYCQSAAFKFDSEIYIIQSVLSLIGINYNHIAKTDYNSIRHLKGSVYYDKNKDCKRDSTETGIAGRILEIQPSEYYVGTDSNGKFETYVDTGIKTITLAQPVGNYKYWKLSPCNPVEYKVHIIDSVTAVNLDFGTYPLLNVKDAYINFTGYTGWRARHGFTEQYELDYGNKGTSVIPSGTVKLILNDSVKLMSAKPSYSSVNNNEYSWNYTNLKPGEQINIDLNINIKARTPVKYLVSISPFTGDTDLHNNYDTLFQKVVASCDPNSKQSNPVGNIKPGTEKLDYLVQFQNLGTDTAYRVYVVDTIETDHLMLSKIEIKGVSHPYRLVINDHTIIWIFDNIKLPPKSTDEPNSQGFIRYSACLKPGLNIGTNINNTAYIYFDYNNTVPTNRILNTISNESGIRENSRSVEKILKVYPNPAQDRIYISCLSSTPVNLDLYMTDVLGNNIRSFRIKNNEIIILDVSDLAKGMYYLKSANDRYSEKILILK